MEREELKSYLEETYTDFNVENGLTDIYLDIVECMPNAKELTAIYFSEDLYLDITGELISVEELNEKKYKKR